MLKMIVIKKNVELYCNILGSESLSEDIIDFLKDLNEIIE